MSNFFEVFVPGQRHQREAEAAAKMTMARPRAAGKPFGVDLEGGTAKINRSEQRDPAQSGGGSGANSDGTDDGGPDTQMEPHLEQSPEHDYDDELEL